MVEISRDLAENLLDDVNELLGGITDLRQYDRYKRRCVAYEAEISELKAALLKEESAKPTPNKRVMQLPGVNVVETFVINEYADASINEREKIGRIAREVYEYLAGQLA